MKQKVAAATAFSEMTQWFLVTIAEGINCDIADPDDDLLAAVIIKQFADRQIAPAPDLAAYLAPRIERSFSAAAAIVAALDAAALATGKPVNRHLARTLLDKAHAAGR